MTRAEKIQNILNATAEVIKENVEKGTMTPDKYAAIMESQNSAILAVEE